MMNYLSRKHDIRSFSVCPENFTGEKGKAGMATEGTGAACARDLGQGWKVSPSVDVPAGTVFTMADICGPSGDRAGRGPLPAGRASLAAA